MRNQNKKLLKNIEEYDAVVVSDYNKGFLKDIDLQEIARRSRLSFLDTKKQFNIDWSDYFTFIKINEKEYLENYKEEKQMKITYG